MTPVGAYVASRHRKSGLEPAVEAPKVTLVRRLYLDLIAFPPTPDELNAALNDTSPKALERLVNQPLDSPLDGER